MTINIEKLRQDMALEQQRFHAEQSSRAKLERWEFLRILIQATAAVATLLAAGAALATLFFHIAGRI